MEYLDYLANMKGCPFCGAYSDHNRKILENENAYLTYSNAPYYRDHLLIIPKRHFEELVEMTDKESEDIMSLQKKALVMLEKLGHKNISVLARNGDGTGRSVKHIHFNIIPEVRLGDMDNKDGKRPVMTEEEIGELMKRFEAEKV